VIVSIEFALTHATKTLAVTEPSARLKTTNPDVHVQKELLGMLTSHVKESKAVSQIVNVQARKLVSKANVPHPVIVASMLNALWETIRPLVSAPLDILEIPVNSVAHPLTLVTLTLAELELYVNLIEEILSATALETWLAILLMLVFQKAMIAQRTLAALIVAAESLMEEPNAFVYLDLKEILRENLVVPLKTLVTPHLVARTHNAQLLMVLQNAAALQDLLKVQTRFVDVSSLQCYLWQLQEPTLLLPWLIFRQSIPVLWWTCSSSRTL
jgi:hypothetical protein